VNIDESQNAKGFTPAADAPGRTIEEIVIHHWGVTGQKHDDVVKFFVSGPGATSAHFVASAGRVTCLVSPPDVAWHAGVWAENLKSIGIECRPEATPEDYRQVAELVAWLRSQYGNLPLRAHREFHATACPGIWDLARLDTLARSLGGAVSPASGTVKPAAPKPAPKPPAAPRARTYPDTDIHWVVGKGDTLGRIAAYYNGPTAARIAAYNNIDPNRLTPGQKVWIPGPLVWVIEGPDTIRSIARYYGLDPAYLARLNGLPGPDATIYIGNRLTIKK
jgi:N-acetylmuramoyl-L-alanine amidase